MEVINPENKVAKELKCLWVCSGKKDSTSDVKIRTLFNQLSVPICDDCYDYNNKIVYLHDKSIDIEVLMILSRNSTDELYDAYKKANSTKYKEKQEKRKEAIKLIGKGSGASDEERKIAFETITEIKLS